MSRPLTKTFWRFYDMYRIAGLDHIAAMQATHDMMKKTFGDRFVKIFDEQIDLYESI